MSLSLAEPLADLLRQAPLAQVAKDFFVIGHLVALAMGIGTVIRTDWSMLRGLDRPFTQTDLDRVVRAHHVVSRALIWLWLTGVGLFLLKTGGDPSAVTPKLMAKLATVSLLSITAMLMADLGLPALRRSIGTRLVHMSTRRRLALSGLMGLSMAGWSTALILGAAATTQLADWAALAWLLAITHVGAVAGAITAAMLAPLIFVHPTQGLRVVQIADTEEPALN